jgi:hypothetical protein
MITAAQDIITFVKTLYDLTNNHQSDSAWLDKSLAFFAEDCEAVDVLCWLLSTSVPKAGRENSFYHPTTIYNTRQAYASFLNSRQFNKGRDSKIFHFSRSTSCSK